MTELPVMSPGSMSGVHCTRDMSARIDWPRARASIDFPTPGTSSNRMWPPAQMAVIDSRTTSSFPWITVLTFSTMRLKAFSNRFTSMDPSLSPASGRIVG